MSMYWDNIHNAEKVTCSKCGTTYERGCGHSCDYVMVYVTEDEKYNECFAIINERPKDCKLSDDVQGCYGTFKSTIDYAVNKYHPIKEPWVYTPVKAWESMEYIIVMMKQTIDKNKLK